MIWGRGVEAMRFWQSPWKFSFVILPQEFPDKIKLTPLEFPDILLHPLEIPSAISKTHGNSTWFFLDHPFNSFPWSLEFPNFIFSIPLKLPCPQPLSLFFSEIAHSRGYTDNFLSPSYIFPVSYEQLIYILLQKFDTLSKKEMKMIKM